MADALRKPPLLPEPHLRPSRFKPRWLVILCASALGLGLLLGGTGQARRVTPATLLGAGMVIFLGLYAWFILRLLRANRQITAAMALITEGKLENAAAQLEQLARRFRGEQPSHGIILYNLASVELRRGQTERALSLAYAAHGRTGAGAFRAMPAMMLSIGYTVLDDLPAAEAWQQEAERLGRAPGFEGTLFSSALLACRQGRYTDALALLDARWSAAQKQLPKEAMRLLRLLRAFALSQTPEGPDGELVRKLISELPETARGEFDGLAVRWPELHAFLRHHNLLSTRAT